MKILVVEDNPNSLQFIMHTVRAMGNVALAAASGSEAIDAFLVERPDIVLLDMLLPDLGGPEVARQIRSLEAPSEWTPIIFLSTRDSDDDLEQGIIAGGDDYLHKPASEVVLRAKIRAMQRIVQMRYSLLAMTKQLDSANRELKRLSTADGLTGLANRRHFDTTLNREWRRSIRQASPIALVLCDVDCFKAFNDTYGHQAGDDCLRRLAEVMGQALVRGGDLAARYGGEEFAVILPDTDIDGALIIAERIRLGMLAVAQEHRASAYGVVTISIGIVAEIAMIGSSAEQLIGAADRALYAAKAAGRNRICRAASGQLV